MSKGASRKNILILSLCQALFMTTQVISTTSCGLVSSSLTSYKVLSTLPVAVGIIGSLMTTIPASLLMNKIGRRNGFLIGAIAGILGSLVCSISISAKSFTMFLIGMFILGIFWGFSTFFRFAAVEVVEESFRSRALSFVLAGGVIAAFAGPQIIRICTSANDSKTYFSTYVSIAILCFVTTIILLPLKVEFANVSEQNTGGRPFKIVASQYKFIIALIGAVAGYSSMMLLMTATPIAMVQLGYSMKDTVNVMQWHTLAMFAPSFFTGALIQRYGSIKISFLGMMFTVISGLILLTMGSLGIFCFIISLVSLGIGWNFCFIGMSTLLTQTYSKEEKAKTQAVNDLFVFGSSAVFSGMSGWMLQVIGWNSISILAIVIIVIPICLILKLLPAKHK